MKSHNTSKNKNLIYINPLLNLWLFPLCFSRASTAPLVPGEWCVSKLSAFASLLRLTYSCCWFLLPLFSFYLFLLLRFIYLFANIFLYLLLYSLVYSSSLHPSIYIYDMKCFFILLLKKKKPKIYLSTALHFFFLINIKYSISSPCPSLCHPVPALLYIPSYVFTSSGLHCYNKPLFLHLTSVSYRHYYLILSRTKACFC